MKFILYRSPEHFTEIKKNELVRCVITCLAYGNDTEDNVIASSIKNNFPSDSDYTYVSHEIIDRTKEEKREWDGQIGKYIPTGEFFDIIHLRIIYSVKVETVEISSLEEMQKFSEQFENPIIMNYGGNRGEYEFPSIHVYDDFIE